METIRYELKGLDKETLLRLYREMLLPRLIEEKMLILLRQGRIAKWFSGIGQEAIAVGCGAALDPAEFILSLHRNLGIFTSRKVPLERLFAQFQGKMSGFTRGRDRSFHFGSIEHRIVGMISHLGPQMGVADGIALGNLLKENRRVTAVFTGDGGTSEGDFHEALNVAAVWDLPVIFIVENNGYGLSTPSTEQYRMRQFIDKGIGYGMEAIQIDGNNIIETYTTMRDIAESIRQRPRPVLLECLTFRMRGHEEASGTKYVPPALLEEWAKKDPLQNYENFLLRKNFLSKELIDSLRAELKGAIEKALEVSFADARPEVNTTRELADVYDTSPRPLILPVTDNKRDMRFLDAISDGMRQAMSRHSRLVIMGQDIAGYGGVFKATLGFLEEFGSQRVRNTPLCESAIVGAAFGLSINGFKAIMEMQFADFVTCGFNQIVNNLAKSHYRWGQHADVVIRMPTGAGVGAGPFHSQSNEAWFVHTPGLKVVYPAFPADAKGLLIASIEDPNPVLFFEHKALYRSISEPVPEDYYTLEIGKAKRVREGSRATIITYGYGVHWALEYLDAHPDVSADLVDLRTLLPWDKETVAASVRKTGRAIVLHEDTLTGGIGGEIAAFLGEQCFEHLDAPVMRCASLDTPVPMNADLEWNFLPRDRFSGMMEQLLSY